MIPKGLKELGIKHKVGLSKSRLLLAGSAEKDVMRFLSDISLAPLFNLSSKICSKWVNFFTEIEGTTDKFKNDVFRKQVELTKVVVLIKDLFEG